MKEYKDFACDACSKVKTIAEQTAVIAGLKAHIKTEEALGEDFARKYKQQADEIERLKKTIEIIGEHENRRIKRLETDLHTATTTAAMYAEKVERLKKHIAKCESDCWPAELRAENQRLKDALFEWMMHLWGLEEDDEVASASHSASYCWEKGLTALDAKSDEELRLRCLEHLKWVAEHALAAQPQKESEE